MKKFYFVLIVVALICLTSCATVFSGSKDEITVISEPEGADVIVNGVKIATTPAVLQLEKNDSHMLTVSLDGYESQSFNVSKKLGAGWLVLDILTGGVAIIVDAVTGNWNNLSPDNIAVTLTPAK